MSNNNFSRRRRGMRFRPKGGLGQAPQKTDREAIEARADVVSEQGGSERVFEKRHFGEIERAENIAAGLPAAAGSEAPPPVPPLPMKRNTTNMIKVSSVNPIWTSPPKSRRKKASCPSPSPNNPKA